MVEFAPEASLLIDLPKMLLKGEDADRAVETALKPILQAVTWDYGEVWLWDQSMQALVLTNIEHADKPALAEFARKSAGERLGMSEGLPGRVLQSKTITREENIRVPGLNEALGIPVVVPDSCTYVMIFYLSPAQAADSKSVELVSIAAKQIEIAIACLQTRKALQKANRSFSRTLEIQTTINRLAALLLKDQSFDETLHDFLEIIIELPWLSFTRKGCLFLVDENTGRLVMRAHYGLDKAIVEACAIVPVGRCLCGKVLELGEMIFKPCADDDHETKYPGMTEHGHYCSPLKTGQGKIIGVLTFYVKHGHVSEEWEVQFIDIASNLLAQIIEKESAQEQKRLTERKLMHLQREESIGRLASGIAHDFNNLLAIILGYTEMTLDSLPEDLAGREDLSEVLVACQRARSLTRQLLLFSRNDVVEKVKLDLNEVAKNLIKMLGRLIGEHIKLEIITPDEPTYVTGDPGQMEQLILNLTINARDAMPMGGRIIIKIGKIGYDEAISDPDQPRGAFAYLTVTDTGTGIPQEALAKIFEPFFTTKPSGLGTGLGLTTVKQIVEQHGGKIEVQTQLQAGTRFTIRFPLTEELEHLYASDNGLIVKKGNGQRILVLEDENILLELAMKILSKNGYTVSGASCPSEALKYLSEKNGACPFDLVFSDLVMTELSGVKLLDFIGEYFSGAKLLITTGYIIQEPELLVHLKKFKIPLLHKPYSVSELLQAAGQSLE